MKIEYFLIKWAKAPSIEYYIYRLFNHRFHRWTQMFEHISPSQFIIHHSDCLLALIAAVTPQQEMDLARCEEYERIAGLSS